MDQRVDAVAFQSVGHDLAALVLRIQINVNVRILPRDSGDHAAHGEGLVRVEFGCKRMMRESGTCGCGQQYDAGDDRTKLGFRFHEITSHQNRQLTCGLNQAPDHYTRTRGSPTRGPAYADV